MSFTVAIIGRPNVGKSTLFNRLVGKRIALVDDTPGVTRDRREGEGRIADLKFRIIDTAGLDEAAPQSLETRMRDQTDRALDDAAVALFLIDSRVGLTPLDEHFANWLRERGTPVVLVANKCEGAAGQAGLMEAFSLGLGDPIPISAEHGEGMGDLYAALKPFETSAEHQEALAAEAADAPLQMAIIGRPNVGKSTLVNHLVGDDRVLTGPEPGITRDAVVIPWTFDGRTIQLIDTAGLRRRAKVYEKLEELSNQETTRAVRFAQVAVLVLDAEAMLEKQDLTIARHVVDEGRALVIAVNKWDLVKDQVAALERLGDRLETSLPQVRGVPVVTMSALTGKGVNKLLPVILKTYDTWNRRIPTARLNRWLAAMGENHPPPLAAGRRIRLRYITQAKSRPPTFILFASRPADLPEAYLRYLVNGLREEFDLSGVPLRLHARRGHNPYAQS